MMPSPPDLLNDSLDRSELWELMRRFAARFLRPFTSADAILFEETSRAEQRLGCQLPPALAEFYQQFGAAGDIWSGQDTLFLPNELKVKDGVVPIYLENQGVWEIAISETDLAQSDPPIVWTNPFDERNFGDLTYYSPFAPSLSVFTMNMLAYCTKFACDPDRGGVIYASEVEAVVERLRERYASCSLRPEWTVGPLFYFQSTDSFIEVSLSDGYIYPTFTNPSALESFSDAFGELPAEWYVVPFEG